jgi:endonuclease/exonuclease/phosphatase (EEP) superfamily protein YafD
LIVLQDWTGRLEAELFGDGTWHRRRDGELFLASRFPIRGAETLVEPNQTGGGAAVLYELETPGGTVHLVNLHLASPHHALEEVMDNARKGIALVDANSRLRRQQSEAVRSRVADLPGPTLLAGDFNTPPASTFFRQNWPPFTDTFSAAGFGWGYTYYTRRSRLRIDYVLAEPGWRCRECRVGPDVGSAHRPVLADLEWTGGEEAL